MSQPTNSSQLADTLKKSAPLLIGAAAVAGSMAGIDLPPWAVEALKQWGPAAIFFLLLIWYVPRSSIQDFIAAQQAQALSIQKVGDQLQVMTGQAGKLDEIIGRLEDLQLNQDVMIKRLQNLELRATDGQP